MVNQVTESSYPINFREADAKKLGSNIVNFESVDLIGMKRVGINNFLRFFLNHQDIASTYISKSQKFIFIPVDLNDLVEREIFAFWALTMKRVVDAIDSTVFTEIDQKHTQSLFLSSIQSQDQFLMIDGIRKTLKLILSADIVPVFFFIRFDRMEDVATATFFNNLQGLKEACNQKLVYVFTGYRELETLSSGIFSKTSMSLFAHKQYIKPAGEDDALVIYSTYLSKYKLKLSDSQKDSLLALSNGYVQYLQLMMTILMEQSKYPEDKESLFDLFISDERITLQSEEIYESLNSVEKEVLQKISAKKSIEDKEKEQASYLYKCGILSSNNEVFSKLFLHYVNNLNVKKDQEIHMSKKEHMLFKYLENRVGNLCEREEIVENVWPEYSEFGVSDWAIDRLVARVRSKLKDQGSDYEIVTIRTRGYKLEKV